MARARDEMIKAVLHAEIWRALERESKEDIDLCLAKGADINSRQNNRTLLEQVITYKQNEDLALHLIDKGADIRAQASEPFLIAARRLQYKKLFKRLLDDGADPNVIYNRSPLICTAVDAGDEASLDLLLQKKADINAAQADGMTALMSAVIRRKSESMVKKLLDHGADIFATDANDKNIFDLIDEQEKQSWSATLANSWRKILLRAMPNAASPTTTPPTPIDPRVKEDTQSAPMPTLAKKPLTLPGQEGGAP